jgi:ribokinase
MSGTPSIAVIGSSNIDMVAYTPRAPGPGETVIGNRFELGFGGKGANQAVMARLLGADVVMVNCVGDDAYAEMTLANFESRGISTAHVKSVPGSSGVAPIWVEPDGTNRIIVIPGANEKVTPEHAAAAIEALPALSVVVGQFEIPQVATGGAFSAARARGITTILNPAPAAELDDALLDVTDWLIPNEVEFASLSGNDSLNDDAFRAFSDRYSVRLLVTLGEEGVALLGLDGKVLRIPASPVVATDTTGAGDAFVGGFSFGMAAGFDEVSAARLGIMCASDSVTRPGTQTSFPDAERCQEILAAVSE